MGMTTSVNCLTLINTEDTIDLLTLHYKPELSLQLLVSLIIYNHDNKNTGIIFDIANDLKDDQVFESFIQSLASIEEYYWNIRFVERNPALAKRQREVTNLDVKEIQKGITNSIVASSLRKLNYSKYRNSTRSRMITLSRVV
jgi:hypothetical protein